MKKILTLLFIIPLFSMTIEKDKAKFVGRWAGEDNKEIGYLNFDAEGYASFEIQGQHFGGKEFVFDGNKAKMTYQVNSKKKPIEVDFTITKLESGEQKKLLCVAEFINDNTMKFAIAFQGNRPTYFNADNSILFKRE